MAGNPPQGLTDDLFEQILNVPQHDGGYGDVSSMPIALQLGSGSSSGYRAESPMNMAQLLPPPPLGLNLEQSFLANNGNNTTSSNWQQERDNSVHMFPAAFGHLQGHAVRPTPPPPTTPQFHSQAAPAPTVPVNHAPVIRPRVRARRGQATDPHSIAERLRRERIAERMKALQELVPSCNKTDRAAMLDEIVDYVKFLRLQVKVLSMSRLGGPGAMAQLVADVPLSAEGEGIEGGINNQQAWDKWSNDGTEQHVAKLMEEDVGAAMQYLQSKALCIMPISLAPAIFRTHQMDSSTMVKPESHNSS